jgi:nuclease S1
MPLLLATLKRRRWFATITLALISLSSPCTAWAWGRTGHRVISRFAKQHLTEKARDAIAELLEPGETLADASTWADEHRRQLPKTAPWHYVDVPLDEPAYDSKWSKDDPKHGCVVDKINEFRKTLKDRTKTVDERRFALRFLVHCLEDMHQPCHVGDNHDRGGNDTQVRFFDRGTNMHALWDTGMIERFSRSEDVWLKELAGLATPQSTLNASRGSVEDWATESLLAAREAYTDVASGERIRPGAKLGDAYLAKNLPAVGQRMYRAGVRLAIVLNECFE